MANAQWWVVWNANSGAVNVVQSASTPATPASGKVFGPYATQAAAQAEAKASPSTGQIIALGVNAGLGSATGGAVGDTQTGSPLTGLAAIGDFFSRLTQANTWERIGMVLLGIVLVAAGVAHLTHAVPVATKIAKTAGVAALA